MKRVRISCANHDRFYAGSDDLVGARPGATGRRARLQGDIEGRVLRDLVPETSKTLNFCVRVSRLTMVSARDYPVPNDQNGADRWIRARLPEGLSRFRKRAA